MCWGKTTPQRGQPYRSVESAAAAAPAVTAMFTPRSAMVRRVSPLLVGIVSKIKTVRAISTRSRTGLIRFASECSPASGLTKTAGAQTRSGTSRSRDEVRCRIFFASTRCAVIAAAAISALRDTVVWKVSGSDTSTCPMVRSQPVFAHSASTSSDSTLTMGAIDVAKRGASPSLCWARSSRRSANMSTVVTGVSAESMIASGVISWMLTFSTANGSRAPWSDRSRSFARAISPSQVKSSTW